VGQQGGFGQHPGAGGGSSLPWLAGGFGSRLSFQAMPGSCHTPRGPEGSCLRPTAHVSLLATQSSGVRLRPVSLPALPVRVCPGVGLHVGCCFSWFTWL